MIGAATTLAGLIALNATLEAENRVVLPFFVGSLALIFALTGYLPAFALALFAAHLIGVRLTEPARYIRKWEAA